jgi:hypothetical protein
MIAIDRIPGWTLTDEVKALTAKGWSNFAAVEYVQNALDIRRAALQLSTDTFACGFKAPERLLVEITEKAARNVTLDARYAKGA